jgi:chloramphenicol-sensitive protein RarD
VQDRTRGLVYALAAYLAWGFLPLYFKALKSVPAPEILAHRVVWSVALLAGFVVLRRRTGAFVDALRPGRRGVLVATTLLIAANWLIYIWAVNAGRVLEASLGYFINPLVNVVLGVAFLGETLAPRQRVAVALAALGVLSLVVQLGTLPWISLALALSFGLYGLLRKRARIDAVGGLLAETALLAPVALAFLLLRGSAGTGAFGGTAGTTALLVSAGAVTAIPLVWFALGVQRLRLSTIGLVQYVAPTGQFLLAVALYHEPFRRAHAVAFGCIWASLALYSWDALARARRVEAAAGAASSPAR